MCVIVPKMTVACMAVVVTMTVLVTMPVVMVMVMAVLTLIETLSHLSLTALRIHRMGCRVCVVRSHDS